MKHSRPCIAIIAALLCLSSVCLSRQDRPAAVAGMFYPAQPAELTSTLDRMFSDAGRQKNNRDIAALIVPHAGYVYCGDIIASAFRQIDPSKHFENIFILGPSHHVGFEGAAVYAGGKYGTPLGAAQVNAKLARELIAKYPVFSGRTDAHAREHSVEVEVPFLQYLLKAPFTIVPIIIGGENPETCRQIADALRPFFNSRNLFIVSSDFSHYPPYEYAASVDKSTADAILKNSPRAFVEALAANSRRDVPNLVTSACGASPILTLLYMTESDPSMHFTTVAHKTSGDSEAGDKSRVVGYYAIACSRDARSDGSSFTIGEAEQTGLLSAARQTIEQYLRSGKVPALDPDKFPVAARTRSGVFVTIRQNNELRGCIGRFDPGEIMLKVIQDMAVAASTQDPRFHPVTAEELPKLNIEISVLTPLKKISSIDEIKLGRDGIYIRKGERTGTFLPEVADETGWTKEEFLGHCAQDKAGLGWDGWKDAEIYIYTAMVFREK